MGDVLFYHLERSPLAAVLPGLLEKSLDKGWRALVRTGDPSQLSALDDALWTYRDDAFLPHGAGDAAWAERQPVWLTHGDDAPNNPDILFLVEGADVVPDECKKFKRTVLIFDGGDEVQLAMARRAWKQVKEYGLEGAYWRQAEGGRWEKQG